MLMVFWVSFFAIYAKAETDLDPIPTADPETLEQLPPELDGAESPSLINIWRAMYIFRSVTSNPDSALDAEVLDGMRKRAFDSYAEEVWRWGSYHLKIYDEEACYRSFFPPEVAGESGDPLLEEGTAERETEIDSQTVYQAMRRALSNGGYGELPTKLDRRDPCYPIWVDRRLDQPAGRNGFGNGGSGRCRKGGC